VGPAIGKFAVVLNKNAKKVTREIADISGELVPPDDLFLSASAKDSEQIAKTLIERNYEAVFAGGGDGTVMHLVNQLARYPIEQQPAIGILKLGTGNAMATMVASDNIAADLKTYIRSATREVLTLSMVETEGIRCPFTGVGLDAEILNDYRSTKSIWSNNVLKPLIESVGGYFFAIFTRTIPRRTGATLLSRQPEVKVTVRKGPAHRISVQGDLLEEYGVGDVLYDGPLTITLAGTVPFYGYGFRILPHATVDPQRMQLRVTNITAAEALSRLPSLWKGEIDMDCVHDFLVPEVHIELSDDAPFQIGGDAAGRRREVTFKTIPNCVRLLRLL
jgi:diacylglycerol kinase family enzyme